MKHLAIIPARGGSKRIPRKNIKSFMGMPIIAYSIKMALESGLFSEVMVSTDDKEIADMARKYGAKVPFMRSNESSDDNAGLTEVLFEVISDYSRQGLFFDCFCCILPTAPLVTSADIIDAYVFLEKNDFDTVYPIVPFSYPILRSLEMDSSFEIKMTWPQYSNTRSQDLKVAYHDTGTFYWVKTKQFVEKGSFDLLKCGGVVFDEMKVQDIDNEIDWKMAELKYQFMHIER